MKTRLAVLRPRFGEPSRLALRTFLCLIFMAASAAADKTLTFSRTLDCYVTTTGRITTTAFTVEMWFKQSGFDSENQLFHQDVGGHAGRLILTTINGTNRFHIGSNMFYGSTRLSTNVWNHVAFVRDASGTGTIYLNGALDRSGALNTQAIAPSNIVIGLLLRAKNGFRGPLSDVRVWNVARTQAEIQANKNTRLTGTEANLIHYWPLDDGSGTVANNRASNAHGTITGATWSESTDLPIVSGILEGAWISAGGGNWSHSANWLNQIVSQGAGAVAAFTNQPPAALSVTNDLADLKLGRLTVSGTSSHTFRGNALTLTNQFAAAQLTSADGSHTFALPLATTACGLFVEPLSPAAFIFEEVISGTGAVTFNPWSSGGGIITLSAANTFTGPTSLGSGTLRIPSLANGSSASPVGASPADRNNLLLGPGTLHVTGPASTDRGLTLQAGSGRAATLRADGDLTLGGPVHAASGAFIKTGAGTVSLTHPGVNTLTVYEGNSDALQNAGTNGDSPTTGFSGLTVNQGKLVLGAPGQTNICNQRVSIGAFTTTNANEETSGELEINDGVFLCNSTLSIGRANGTETTAPGGLNSKLTLNGGAISVNLLALGFIGNAGAGFNARPACVINGGSLTVATYCNIAENTGSVATVTVSGGTLRVTGTDGNSLRVGGGQTVGGTGTVTLSGDGAVDANNDVSLAFSNSSYGTLNLDGGTLTARNIVKGSGLAGILNLNGGLFLPRAAGRTLSGLTAAYIRSGGARIDTSLADYTVAQNLLHDPAPEAGADGGLTKSGTGTLTLTGYGSTYDGPTHVAGGTLRVAGSLPPDNALTVAAEGEALLGGSATQTVSAASLALADGGTLGFAFTSDGASNDRLSLPASPSLANKRIALYIANTREPFCLNGTYTLLAYAGGAAPGTTGLACANPVSGKTYVFAAAAGAVTVTIGSDTAAASVWAVDDDGAWSAPGNWTLTAPSNGPGSVARLDSVITKPVTIATAGETVGTVTFNNLNPYTLGGSGLTLDSHTEAPALNVEVGAHTVAAPLDLAADAAINLASGTTLSLGAVSGASSTLTAQGNATLALTAAPAVQALTLGVTELGLSNAITVATPIALARSVSVRPQPGTTASLTGTLSGTNGLTKVGASTLTLSAANTYTGVTRLDAGTLSVPALADGGQPSPVGASAFNAANLLIGPATFRYAGPSNIVSRGLTLQAGSTRAAVVRVEAGGDIAFGGWINAASGGFVKTGPGTLRYTGNANNVLHKDNVSSDARLNIGANGDGPTAGFFGCSIADGRLVLGAPFQTNTVSSRLVVGINTTTEAAAETAGELVVSGGVLNMAGNVLAVGRNNGTTVTAPGGLSSRLTVTGGLITNANFISLGYQNMSLSGYNARPVLEMSGGYVHVNNFYIAESSGANAAVTLRGGILRPYGTARFAMAANTSASFTLDGDALFETVGAFDTQLGYNSASTTLATLRLNGGTLSTRNVVKAANAQGTLFFNGGTFRPHTAGQTLQNLTAAYVSTNGAVLDTSLAAYTVAQNLTRDPALGSALDGGLAKLGTNTLSLTGTGNTFNGPVRVQSGLLRARLGGTNDLFVAAGAAFDALGVRCEVGDLTGAGPCTNGILAVHGRLDAGTNGAPAGASMSVQNLALAAGSTFACDWTTNALGQVINDTAAVTDTLASEGAGFVDLGRAAGDPIPMPFTATLMSYGSLTGSFAGWKAVNTGLPAGVAVATRVSAANNVVTLHITYGGTLLLLK